MWHHVAPYQAQTLRSLTLASYQFNFFVLNEKAILLKFHFGILDINVGSKLAFHPQTNFGTEVYNWRVLFKRSMVLIFRWVDFVGPWSET